jgi:hypothetical protein
MISSESYSSNVMNCNAYSMPIDDGMATLQFEKGYEGGHGANLHCFHPSCKKNGVKFLYCKHCEKAVGKKHFPRKHSHPELIALNAEIPVPSLPTEMPKREDKKKLANMQKQMDTIKRDYEKQLTDMQERLGIRLTEKNEEIAFMQERIGIRLREKDEEIESINIISSAEAKIETFRKFMPDQNSQDDNITYLPTFIDLFMIGRCDTDTHAWSAHEIQILIYALQIPKLTSSLIQYHFFPSKFFKFLSCPFIIVYNILILTSSSSNV